ncbi:hypothetical protein [Nocardia sp. NPDC051832]|uniref:hypothetical protein n=1 Tax=Nocardia sp. NPDC051832 TaxID=3155673 RepID=UPI003424BC71
MDPESSGQWPAFDRAVRRWRIAWLVTVAALLVAAPAAVLAIYVSDRFYRLQEIPFLSPMVCWLATGALIVYAPRWGWPRLRARLVPAVVLAFEVVPLLPLMLLWAAFAPGPSAVVAVEVSSDGRHEVVTHYVKDVIDTLCAVRLRERVGVFSRQTSVWTGVEGERCPQRVSFIGDDRISILDGRGREITARFDAGRMQLGQLVRQSS